MLFCVCKKISKCNNKSVFNKSKNKTLKSLMYVVDHENCDKIEFNLLLISHKIKTKRRSRRYRNHQFSFWSDFIIIIIAIFAAHACTLARRRHLSVLLNTRMMMALCTASSSSQSNYTVNIIRVYYSYKHGVYHEYSIVSVINTILDQYNTMAICRTYRTRTPKGWFSTKGIR